MRRALTLARRGWGRTAPNPMVGAVVAQDGATVGEGWHREYGGPHAEVHALAQAGERARGATAYVTLEPCAHHGKTPPCVDALIAAGVARVVVAVRDPNPVAAGGVARLRAAGIVVDEDVETAAARELNAPFLHAARGGDRPWITLKLALSLDGAIADHTRGPGWLTGPVSRRAVHRMRAGSDAIAVGIGTALADDPSLTVREGPAPRRAPIRVVFDRRLRLPIASRLVRTVAEAAGGRRRRARPRPCARRRAPRGGGVGRRSRTGWTPACARCAVRTTSGTCWSRAAPSSPARCGAGGRWTGWLPFRRRWCWATMRCAPSPAWWGSAPARRRGSPWSSAVPAETT